ncbi:GntR family transcriptional regulator [Streptomyces bluensis]|uniref:GntR family transcriptional regulator n=1 Tax=Streptomyces bluensis TaxID=33897 RepID=A0ABW6UFU1_9ACTN
MESAQTESAQTESAHARLVELIRAGAFRPGEVLRASRLAEMVGQSRTPVREALTRLAAEGIVELRPNRGARLITLEPDDIAEIFSIRSLLESDAAALAAERATKADIDRMVDLMERLELAGQPTADQSAEALRLNADFHLAVIRAARAPLLEAAYVRANREPLVAQQVSPAGFDHARQSHQHRDVVDAIQHRNPAWARAAMFNHAETARATMVNPPVPNPGSGDVECR